MVNGRYGNAMVSQRVMNVCDGNSIRKATQCMGPTARIADTVSCYQQTARLCVQFV